MTKKNDLNLLKNLESYMGVKFNLTLLKKTKKQKKDEPEYKLCKSERHQTNFLASTFDEKFTEINFDLK